MGITSSLITGLSGLASNQSKLDVIGNNIANVNTVGFKSARMDFKTQFSQTFSYGSTPTGDLGGTNPLQVGMGVVQGAVSRNFNDGSREVTGVTSNLAIEGDGFFVLKDGPEQTYTRDGTFKLNSLNQLVNADGARVQGFGVDSSYSIVPGVLGDVTIPLGALTVAEATTSITMAGNLNTNGALPSQVADLSLDQPFYVTDGAGGVTGAAPTATTLLADLTNASGQSYFQLGDTLTLTGDVGARSIAAKTLDVGAATTLADFMSFITGTLGINTSPGANGNVATTPGTSLAAGPAGAAVLTIDGNIGANNDLTLIPGSLSITNSAGTSTPFTWTKNSSADGESIATSTIIYDSLGTPVKLTLTAALVSRDAAGATWRFFATSPDGTATDALTQTAVGTGTLSFDTAGRLLSSSSTSLTIDRTGTGANPNLTFNVDFSEISGLADTISNLGTTLVNGSAKGTLTEYSIDQSGFIKGTFSNGLTRTLGQVALATFRNNQGLVDKGNNTWQEGPNSGTAVISAPGQFTAGNIISGTLELSNVDLSSEFVQLISASTGFSASSRVITTSNQLLQELLAAAR
jgi:flagellar hook protein FlgE